MYFKENVSIVYHELLKEVGELEIPNEEFVDCRNCSLCSHQSLIRFNTKCCDYQPSLTNFITGSILSDFSGDLATGSQLVLDRIHKKLGVTPFGILPSSNYNKAFQLSRDEEALVTQEQTTALKCSFLKNGNCTVYKYRSDICGLHQCSSVSLDHGLAFWEKAKRLNLYLDKHLSLLVAKKMGIPDPINIPKELKSLSSLIETESGKIDENKYKKVWGDWNNKEVAFYKECSSIFQSLGVKELKVELGQNFEKLQTSLAASAVPFNSHISPDFLIFNEEKWKKSSNYKLLTPIMLMHLRLFNGKSKTVDVVKKAAFMQLGLNKIMTELMAEDCLSQKIN